MSDIIRCKDCKHLKKWRTFEQAAQFGQIYECDLEILSCPEPDDYCSKAEKIQMIITKWCNTCEYKHLESECLGCAEYDDNDNLIDLRNYKKEAIK